MKRHVLITAACLALVLSAVPLWAQRSVSETVAAAADGVVEIENLAGSVSVEGWSKNEVEVTGSLGRGVERVEVEGDGHRTTIEVRIPHDAHNVGDTDLKIRVPAGSRVEVETVSASIDVGGVRGSVDLESVSGRIEVAGEPQRLEVSSVSGKVTVASAPADAELESVSAAVVVERATGRLQVSSVSGTIEIQGGALSGGEFETVSGTIRCEADLVGSGSFEFETMSGSIVLVIPRGLAADFELSTFSGSIANAVGPEPTRTSRFTPGKEATFSTGSGGPRITANSFSGSVKLETR